MRGAGRALGIAIASLAMTLNIERFVIGGSVAGAADLLLPPARESLRQYAFPRCLGQCPLERLPPGRRRCDSGRGSAGAGAAGELVTKR